MSFQQNRPPDSEQKKRVKTLTLWEFRLDNKNPDNNFLSQSNVQSYFLGVFFGRNGFSVTFGLNFDPKFQVETPFYDAIH